MISQPAVLEAALKGAVARGLRGKPLSGRVTAGRKATCTWMKRLRFGQNEVWLRSMAPLSEAPKLS
jgi:hypothetical protein